MADLRAAEVLYNSEAALRLVMSQLGELGRGHDVSGDPLPRGEEIPHTPSPEQAGRRSLPHGIPRAS